MKKPLFFFFLFLSSSFGKDLEAVPDLRKRQSHIQQNQNVQQQQLEQEYLDHLDHHPTLDDLLDKIEGYVIPPIWTAICFSASCVSQCLKEQWRYMEREAAELAEILPSYNQHFEEWKVSINPLFQP